MSLCDCPDCWQTPCVCGESGYWIVDTEDVPGRKYLDNLIKRDKIIRQLIEQLDLQLCIKVSEIQVFLEEDPTIIRLHLSDTDKELTISEIENFPRIEGVDMISSISEGLVDVQLEEKLYGS